MNLLVYPTKILSGQVTPPSSKSQTIRGLIFALLAKGKSTLHNVLDSDDVKDALRVCQDLGANITHCDNTTITINSMGLPLQTTLGNLYTGNSGITTRFILPCLGFRANARQSMIFDCGEQMRARPIRPLVEALRNLGVHIRYLKDENVCPIEISGELKGGDTEVEGLSSQYLTALLIALPCAQKDSQITVKNLHERPYIDITLDWLREQKIHFKYENKGELDIFHISGQQSYHSFEKTITGDFSSASYLITAGVLVPGTIQLMGLNMQDPQGDKRLITILKQMGADICVDADQIVIRGGKKLTGFKIDANDIPDLLPVLAVLGTQAAGKTEICNVRQARIKETDRIHSMCEGLKAMGAKVEEYPDGMTVYESRLQGAQIKGYDDHRTVMSFAVAGLLAQGETCIDDAQAILKTFPHFVDVMCALGARMQMAAIPPEKSKES